MRVLLVDVNDPSKKSKKIVSFTCEELTELLIHSTTTVTFPLISSIFTMVMESETESLVKNVCVLAGIEVNVA